MASIVHRSNKDGSVTSMVRFRVDGKQVSQSFVTAEGAESFAEMVEAVGGAAAIRAREARNSSSMPTLREFFEEWINPANGHLTNIDSGTRKGYRSAAERSFLIRLGEYPMDKITRQDCAAWLEWQRTQLTTGIRQKGTLPSTRTLQTFQVVLSGVFKAAQAATPKITDHNPALGLRVKGSMAKGATFLTPYEFEVILHFVPDYWKPLILFLVGTGMRFSEATAITWKDIDISGAIPMAHVTKAWKRRDDWSWEIGTPKTKAGKRSISLTAELVEALGERQGGDELVFQNIPNGGHIPQTRVYQAAWTRARLAANDPEKCAEIGAKPIGKMPRLHDLRHSHASWLIAAHASLPYIQQRLGHEKITTTIDIYGHLAPEAQAQMAEIVAQSMESVLPRLRLTDAITNGDELVAQITE